VKRQNNHWLMVGLLVISIFSTLALAGPPPVAWSRFYDVGGVSPLTYVYAIIPLGDTGYLIGGCLFTGDCNTYNCFLKIGINGDSLQYKEIHKPEPYYDWSSPHQMIKVGNSYLVAGGRYDQDRSLGKDDFYLLKINASCDSVWWKYYGDVLYNTAYSLQPTADGGYIMAGYEGISYRPQNCTTDVCLIKIDRNFHQSWLKCFGGDSCDIGYAVKQTSDGGYVIAGATKSFGAGNYDIYLIKTDSLGNLLWQKTFGGDSSDIGYALQIAADGGYVIAGVTNSFGVSKSDAYLIKTDSLGNLIWQKTFGSWENEAVYDLKPTADGGYIMVGYECYGGTFVIKTTGHGDVLWTTFFDVYGSWGDPDGTVEQTADGGYIITKVGVILGTCQIYVAKLSAEGIEESKTVLRPEGGSSLTVNPNPIKQAVTISYHLPRVGYVNLGLYDLQGRRLQTLFKGWQAAGSYQKHWNRTGQDGRLVPTGVYFVKLEASEVTATTKILLF